MTGNQIKWASTHDWFIQDNFDGSILVRDQWTKDGVLFSDVLQFNNYRELRAWAGY
jgi:hypothetical protein